MKMKKDRHMIAPPHAARMRSVLSAGYAAAVFGEHPAARGVVRHRVAVRVGPLLELRREVRELLRQTGSTTRSAPLTGEDLGAMVKAALTPPPPAAAADDPPRSKGSPEREPGHHYQSGKFRGA